MIGRLRKLINLAILGILILLFAGASLAKAEELVENKQLTHRLYGQDRYETAAVSALEAYEQVDRVILARGDKLFDALAGSVLAGVLDAPILLTMPDELHEKTSEVITDLGAQEIVILGGDAAVSPVVAEELANQKVEVTRIKGSNRYETAAAVAKQVEKKLGPSFGNQAFIVSGSDVPDAMVVGPYAAANGKPILLAQKDYIPEGTAAALDKLGIDKITVIGGPAAVGENIKNDLNAERIYGADRYETSIEVAKAYFNEPGKVIIASGNNNNIVDALAGSYLGAKLNAPILYSYKEHLPSVVNEHLKSIMTESTSAYILGGSEALSQVLQADISNTLLLQGKAQVLGRVLPIIDAEVAIYDLEGNLVYQSEKAATGEFGSFRIDVKDLPSDFRIVVKGGKYRGENFADKLMADYRDFDPARDNVYVNAATTMLSAYLDANPGTTLDEGTAAVKKFLEIPEWLSIGGGLQRSGEYFSYELFMSEAEQNGGVNQYIDQLLAKMPDTRHFRPDEPPLKSVTGFIASNLAKGAVSYVGGELMGWGLSKVGVSFGEEDYTQEQLAKIMDGMHEMQGQLSEIEGRLDRMDQKLDAIIDRLEEMRRQELRSRYKILRGQTSKLESQINEINTDLINFIVNPPKNLEDNREALLERIQDNIIGNDTVLHSNLMETLGLWGKITYENKYITPKDYEAIEAHFEYYHQLQEIFLLLQVEYYHYMLGEGDESVERRIERHFERIKAQEKLLKKAIPENIIFGTKNDIMFYVKPDILFGGYKYLMPPSYVGGYHGHIDEIVQDLNESKHLGYDDWRYLENINDMEGLMPGIRDVCFEDYTLMEYFTDRGWPMPKGYQYRFGAAHGLDGRPQSCIVSERNPDTGAVTFKITGLPDYMRAYFFIFRIMDSSEAQKYYYIE